MDCTRGICELDRQFIRFLNKVLDLQVNVAAGVNINLKVVAEIEVKLEVDV